ncbi:MAG TPA: hypothetical protein VES95_01300 [Dermatophilaceae bacterium]|nr:hypothetical protein [Dermatophilaceae bacterium]
MCDTLVAVTDDGLLLGKNSDRDVNEAQGLHWYAAAEHPPGAVVRCTWSTIAQAPRTFGVLLSQPWWMWGAEMGANEHGVAIGNEAVFTRDAPRPRTGSELLGMDLLRLALERAVTADEAVELIVSLLERHGQGGSCSHERSRYSHDSSFLVVDTDRAWVLETAGTAWATEPVTGPGRSISNGLTIADFARRHAHRTREQFARCGPRRARTERAAALARGPGDVMAALRDHDGPVPRWSPVTGALGAPCAHAGGAVVSSQTTAAWVSDLRSAPQHWATGTAATCTATFLPLPVGEAAAGLAESAPGVRPLRNVFDADHRWWRHELLHRLALRDLSTALPRFGQERDALEAAWLSAAPDELPGPAEAAEVVDAAEARWLADLRAADLPDRRASWLRAMWSRLDGAAHLPGAEHEAAS